MLSRRIGKSCLILCLTLSLFSFIPESHCKLPRRAAAYLCSAEPVSGPDSGNRIIKLFKSVLAIFPRIGGTKNKVAPEPQPSETPTPPPCLDGQIPVSEINRAGPGWEVFLATQYATTACIDLAFYQDFRDLIGGLCEGAYPCEYARIHEIYRTIRASQDAWREEARTKNEHVDYTFTEGGRVHILPTGEIYLEFNPVLLGRGGFKAAFTQVSFSQTGGIEKMVVLKPHRTPETTAMAQADIAHEWAIYQAIEAYRARQGGTIAGLPTAKLIFLHDRTHALVQPRYEGNLERTDLDIHTVQQLVRGVGHLHAIGYVHGDIKEGNAFYRHSSTGEREVVISDFGLSRPTGESFIGGTRGYMAPEVSQGTMSPSRDIYALGILYLKWIPDHQRPRNPLLGCSSDSTSSREYWGCVQARAEDLHQQMTAIIPSHCLETRLCKEAIVADCLSPDPSRRPTAAVLESRIAHIAATPPVLFPPPPPHSRPRVRTGLRTVRH